MDKQTKDDIYFDIHEKIIEIRKRLDEIEYDLKLLKDSDN